jgi:hypothetical protein
MLLGISSVLDPTAAPNRVAGDGESVRGETVSRSADASTIG